MTVTTPHGRPVLPIEGDADAMAAQGTTLIHFGELMNECGMYMNAIGTDHAVGKGFSIDSLQEISLNCGDLIDHAGLRYCTQGIAVNIYAEAFDDAQEAIRVLVLRIEELDARRARLEEHISELHGFGTLGYNTVCEHPDLFTVPPLPQTLDQEEIQAYNDAINSERTLRLAQLQALSYDLESNLAAYDREFETWEEATATALAALKNANEITADSTAEKVYHYMQFTEDVIAVVTTIVDGISLLAAATGVGIEVAAALEAGNMSLKAMNVALTVGRKCFFPDGSVHRAVGQREREGADVVASLWGLIPFSGTKRAVSMGFTAIQADATSNRFGHKAPGAWHQQTREHPYEPPRRRADGTPRTTTYRVPR